MLLFTLSVRQPEMALEPLPAKNWPIGLLLVEFRFARGYLQRYLGLLLLRLVEVLARLSLGFPVKDLAEANGVAVFEIRGALNLPLGDLVSYLFLSTTEINFSKIGTCTFLPLA